jgi:hypothetical protein
MALRLVWLLLEAAQTCVASEEENSLSNLTCIAVFRLKCCIEGWK